MSQQYFVRLFEAAKALSDPAREGDRQKAAVRLAKEYGFSGRTNYLLSIADIYAKHTDFDDFCAAVEQNERIALQIMVLEMKQAEISVKDSLRSGSDVNADTGGQCYRRAFSYVQAHQMDEAVLVHGSVFADARHSPHAWVELPDEIVFEGVLQHFYNKAMYYKFRDAKPTYRYTAAQARSLLISNGNYGAWE